jgi:hypothetical protein
MQDPARENERIDTELPAWMKSRIDKLDPTFSIPYKLKELPRRSIDLSEQAEPSSNLSRADKLDPSLQ